MISGHLVRRNDEVLPCWANFAICLMPGAVQMPYLRLAPVPAGNEQEELNESRPQLPFRGIGCDFPNSTAIYSRWHTAPVAEQESLPKADIALSWILREPWKRRSPAPASPHPSLCLPCLHRFSALMNHRNLTERVW